MGAMLTADCRIPLRFPNSPVVTNASKYPDFYRERTWGKSMRKLYLRLLYQLPKM